MVPRSFFVKGKIEDLKDNCAQICYQSSYKNLFTFKGNSCSNTSLFATWTIKKKKKDRNFISLIVKTKTLIVNSSKAASPQMLA